MTKTIFLRWLLGRNSIPDEEVRSIGTATKNKIAYFYKNQNCYPVCSSPS